MAEPTSSRLAVRVTRDALRQIRGGHPWVFDGSIVSASREGEAGDLAVVFDDRRRFAAIGLWDPSSPIRLKVLHHGRPLAIDAAFWADRVEAALRLRSAFTERSNADRLAYRVVHGENDGLPGLVADRYADVLVVKIYTAAWLPHLESVLAALRAQTGCSVVVLRSARLVRRDPIWTASGWEDGDVVAGQLPGEWVRFEENGCVMDADVRHGQKTGYFLDQRANRARVRDHAQGADVLDMFCSTGGFTVHAAAGGAASVTSVDRSVPTLAMVEHNLDLNRNRPNVVRCRFTQVAGEAFAVMADLGREGRRFDLVVVDPPSFAQRQADIARAERAYQRLTVSALRLLRPGGLLVQASCSSRIPASRFFDLVEDAAQREERRIRLVRRTGHDIDHPVGFPQGEYLKAGFWNA